MKSKIDIAWNYYIFSHFVWLTLIKQNRMNGSPICLCSLLKKTEGGMPCNFFVLLNHLANLKSFSLSVSELRSTLSACIVMMEKGWNILVVNRISHLRIIRLTIIKKLKFKNTYHIYSNLPLWNNLHQAQQGPSQHLLTFLQGSLVFSAIACLMKKNSNQDFVNVLVRPQML